MKRDFIIFGGIGDLSLRKLLPSLYYLYRDGQLSEDFRISCVSRADKTHDEFVELVRSKLVEFLDDDFDAQVFASYSKILSYKKVDLTDKHDWQKFADDLNIRNDGGREIIYYLSVPPTMFATVCERIREFNLNPEYSRLVVEKPLGEDFDSASKINSLLNVSFDEKQIFRIDHYLGKPALQKILDIRSNDPSLEEKWNKENIKRINITVSETVGVEGRVEFLDRAGVLRDMIQNHLMQILSFIAMDLPAEMAADAIRDQKVSVVEALAKIGSDNVKSLTVKGQYIAGNNMPGYIDEIRQQNENAAGTGETFVEVKVYVENDRWQGMPFYLRTGKRLAKRLADVEVIFKDGEKVVVEIQPEICMREISSDSEIQIERVLVDKSKRIPEAYEFLIHQIVKGDQTYFVRDDEIMASWKWIDGIRAGWQATNQKIIDYKAGSNGPELE